MKPFRNLVILTALLFSLSLPACSKSSDSKKESKDTKPVTDQAKEAIQDYGRKPIERARAAQGLGEDRTKAIDQAVESKDR